TTAQPDRDDAWAAKGQLLLMLGRHADALPCFERALKLNPDNDQALGSFGESLLRAHRFKEAEEYILRFMKKRPDHAKALVFLATTHELMGQKEKALEDYARFLWRATNSSNDMAEQIKFARTQHAQLLKALRPEYPDLPVSNADAQLDKAYQL